MAKILIVDDEPRIRELIREHLQYAGYVCEEAVSYTHLTLPTTPYV